MRWREMSAPWPLRGKDKEDACSGEPGAGGLRPGELRSRVLDPRAVPESGPGRDPTGGRCADGPRAKRPCQVSAPLSGRGSSKAAGLRAPGPPKTMGEGQKRSGCLGKGRASSGGRAGCSEGPRSGSRRYRPSRPQSPPLRTAGPGPPSPLPPSRSGLRNVLALRRSSEDAFGSSVLRAV